MKKLSFLIALCLLVTVGGVYATWTYTSVDSAAGEDSLNLPVGITTATVTSLAGDFSFANANSLKINIDQDSAETHRAKLAVDGSLTLQFIPTNLGENPASTMNVKYKITAPIYAYGDCENIFTQRKNAEEEIVLTLVDGVYTYTFPTGTLAQWIIMNSEFDLPTIEDYNKFHTYLQSNKINFVVELSAEVSDNPTPTAP